MGHVNRFARHEIRVVLIVSVLVVVVTGLPYVYGYLSVPDDEVFMGIAANPPDTNQYFAWVRAFTRAPLISNTLTAEPNEPIFFNLLWWSLAQGVRWLGLSLSSAFQIFRALAGVAFLLAAYVFCALFIGQPSMRRTAFLVIALGAGFGWVLVIGKYLTGRLTHPLDVYIIEPNSFLSIMAFPHFAQAACLILTVFALVLLAYERQQWRYSLLAAAVGLVLGWTHAYDLLLVYAVLWMFSFIVWLRDGWSPRLVWYPAVITLISCPPAIYSVYMTSASDAWRQVLTQFVHADAWTPDPFRLLIVMGLPFIVALLAFDGLVPLRTRSLRELFLKTWFGVNLFVIYLPVSYQIHYLNGWQVPVAILATSAVYRRIIPWLQEQAWLHRLRGVALSRIAVVLFISVTALTNVYLLAWRFVDLSRHQNPYYLHVDEVEALRWLEAHTQPEDVVLSGIGIGQYIPSVAGNRAFLAHWAMTIDVYEKEEMVRAFFSTSASDQERRAVLQGFDVRYVLYGTAEREFGRPAFEAMSYLEKVFSAPQATVYRVQLDGSKGP